MILDGPYYKLIKRKDQRLHCGFDYHGKVLQKTTSQEITNKDGVFREYMTHVEKIFSEIIDNIKAIKAFANVAVDKDSREIN